MLAELAAPAGELNGGIRKLTAPISRHQAVLLSDRIRNVDESALASKRPAREFSSRKDSLAQDSFINVRMAVIS